jgi:ribonuclease D
MAETDAPGEIRTTAALREALAVIDAAELVAIDTEFMRVDTYYPKFCLLQIATPTAVYCIDPLADVDLAELGARLAATRQPKLMHAARQDLEVLGPIGAGNPQPLIDTQLAAALLGLSNQISYAAVVEQYCGVAIDKSQTRTD